MTSELKCLTNSELSNWCKQGKLPENIVVIDVREPGEYRREHIPGSRNVPVSMLGKTDFSADKEKIAVFHCRSGNRTKAATDAILACGFKEAYCLPEGIEQWKKCNLPIVLDKNAPIDIMRQVQIAAGSLVVVGVLLGYLFSPYFVLISAFVGAGLINAGVTGSCHMAKMLAWMPWNRE
jgi:rhodanese-related sulfurtransferase